MSRQLRDRRPDGARAGRLHGDERDAHLRPRRDHQDRHRAGQRRPARRGQRDLHASTSRTRSTRRSPTAQGVGTITDDDALPALSIDDVTVTEGNAGTSPHLHRQPRRRQRPSSHRQLRDRQRHGDGARRLHGGDRRRSPSPPARRTQTITVPVNGDTLDEANETFCVNLTNPRQRDDRRRHGRRHDHRRRRACRRCRSTTSR